jgi:hypothetical protein
MGDSIVGQKKETRKELTPSYDRIIKAGLQPYYGDVAAWLLGTRPVEVRTVDTSLVTPVERLADRILEVRFRRRPAVLLHIEFQLSGGGDMPKRMAQYAALILDLLDAPEHRGKEFSSAVVYLDRRTYREDPGCIDRALSPGVRFTFSYRVVKLWEVEPGPILDLQAPGLWPFIPLMRGDPQELLMKSREKILAAPDRMVSMEAKQRLLLVQSGLASRLLKDLDIARSLLSEIQSMGEKYLFEMIAEQGLQKGLEKGREEGRLEGREEGLEEGAREEARDAVLEVLRRRFGKVSRVISQRLRSVEDLPKLKMLVGDAAVIRNLEAFLGLLPRGRR